jgi:hypothetical protein
MENVYSFDVFGILNFYKLDNCPNWVNEILVVYKTIYALNYYKYTFS